MRRGLIGAAAAAAGVAALWWAFPRYDEAAQVWNLHSDREESIAQAHTIAREFGLETGGWRAAVSASTNRTLIDAQRAYGSNEVLALVTPATITVTLLDPKIRRSVVVVFGSDGRVTRYNVHGTSGRASAPDSAGVSTVKAAFQRIAGEQARRFRPVAAVDMSAQGTQTFTWEWIDPAAGMSAPIRVRTRQDAVELAELVLRLPSSFEEEDRRRRTAASAPLGISLVVACWILVPLASILFFTKLARRRAHARFAFSLMLALSVPAVLYTLWGGGYDAALRQSVEDAGSVASNLLMALVIELAFLGIWAMLYGAGFALVTRRLRPAWVGLTLFSMREWNHRAMARGAMLGLLAAPLAVALPYAWAALTGASISTFGVQALVERNGMLSALLQPAKAVDAIATMLFLLPLGAAARGPAILRWTVGGAVALLSTAAIRQAGHTTAAGEIAVAGLFLAGWAFAVWLGGVWGLWWTIIGSYLCLWSAAMFAQPSPGLHDGALWPALAYAALLAGFAVWQRLAPEPGIEAAVERLDPEREAQIRSEREQLEGEFAIARRAQEGMLPAEAPKVEGFDLAARCRPAREVGGDLYDFLELPDGRWLLTVADVSGKGVPAALFMTFTKGLLAAAARHHNRLEDIAAAVNTHFHEQAQRRLFVTMVLAAMDPRDRSVEVLRAGHNPPLMRRRGASSGEWLQPPGLGMGLTGAGLFAAKCGVERYMMEPGDTLLFYSDGLPEAMNGRWEQFGEERMERWLCESEKADAGGVVSGMMAELDRFVGDADPHDDVTVVAVRAS